MIRCRPRRLACCLLVGTSLALPASADVLVVDASGGGDHTCLDDAIAAAAEGDTLLVRSTCATSATVQAKSLTLVFDGDEEGLLLGGLSVRDLGPGQRVVLRGLKPTLPPTVEALSLVDNVGHVWVEDCTFRGGIGNVGFFGMTSPGRPGVLVSGSSSVTFVRCRLYGGRGFSGQVVPPNICAPASAGGPGARVQFGSKVAFYQCDLSGADGGNGNVCLTSAQGGDGLHVLDSDVFLSGCTASGGPGGVAGNSAIGAGGAGLAVGGTGAVTTRDGHFAGGAGGTGPGAATGARASGSPPPRTRVAWMLPWNVRQISRRNPRCCYVLGSSSRFTLTADPSCRE
jgi:hypothetical protein